MSRRSWPATRGGHRRCGGTDLWLDLYRYLYLYTVWGVRPWCLLWGGSMCKPSMLTDSQVTHWRITGNSTSSLWRHVWATLNICDCVNKRPMARMSFCYYNFEKMLTLTCCQDSIAVLFPRIIRSLFFASEHWWPHWINALYNRMWVRTSPQFLFFTIPAAVFWRRRGKGLSVFQLTGLSALSSRHSRKRPGDCSRSAANPAHSERYARTVGMCWNVFSSSGLVSDHVTFWVGFIANVDRISRTRSVFGDKRTGDTQHVNIWILLIMLVYYRLFADSFQLFWYACLFKPRSCLFKQLTLRKKPRLELMIFEHWSLYNSLVQLR